MSGSYKTNENFTGFYTEINPKIAIECGIAFAKTDTPVFLNYHSFEFHEIWHE